MDEVNIEELLQPYWVLSPEYSSGGSYDPPEPPEYGRDCVGVMAFDVNHAKVQGVKAMRKNKWCGYIQADPYENPYANLEVNLAICEHGVWHFTDADEEGNVSGEEFLCNDCIEGGFL